MILNKHAHGHTTGIPTPSGLPSAAALEQTGGYNAAHCRGRAAGWVNRWNRRAKVEKAATYGRPRSSFTYAQEWMFPFNAQGVMSRPVYSRLPRGSTPMMKRGQSTACSLLRDDGWESGTNRSPSSFLCNRPCPLDCGYCTFARFAWYSYWGASFASCRGDTVALVSVDFPPAMLYSILLARSSVELFLARWTFHRNWVSGIFRDMMRYLHCANWSSVVWYSLLQCVDMLLLFTVIVWIALNGKLVKILALFLLQYLLCGVGNNWDPMNGLNFINTVSYLSS